MINQIENFLDPKIKYSMPDPSLLLDIDKAINIFIEAINFKKKLLYLLIMMLMVERQQL